MWVSLAMNIMILSSEIVHRAINRESLEQPCAGIGTEILKLSLVTFNMKSTEDGARILRAG